MSIFFAPFLTNIYIFVLLKLALSLSQFLERTLKITSRLMNLHNTYMIRLKLHLAHVCLAIPKFKVL